MEIRRIDREKGDITETVTLEKGIAQVEQALNQGALVVEETPEEKRIIKNALGLKEESKVRFYPKVAGG